MPTNIEQLQNRIEYKFRDSNLLLLALTHPSVEVREVDSNRRLEFFGDRVLGMIIAEALYERYPTFDEGKLTMIFHRITNNASSAEHAKAIGLAEHLRINSEYPKLRTLNSSLADAFEALVGAINRDGGSEAARDFVRREFEADLNDTSTESHNPKGELQEFLQTRSQPAPTYILISASGPDHKKSFVCAAIGSDVELGRGTGRSIREAETNAAKEALEQLRTVSLPR